MGFTTSSATFAGVGELTSPGPFLQGLYSEKSSHFNPYSMPFLLDLIAKLESS